MDLERDVDTYFPRYDKPTCGARTRRGTPCMSKKLLRGARCKLHGGGSSGPKTENGKRRAAENLGIFKCR
jgi:hypothetical protein